MTTEVIAMPLAAFLDSLLPLAQSGQWDAVHAECRTRTESMGEEEDVLYLQGLAAFARNDIAEAASAAARALAVGSQFAECADLIAITHGLAGDLNTALYYAKLAITLPARTDLQAFYPAEFPNFAAVLAAVEQNRLVNRAKIAMGKGQLDLADNFLRQHLSFFPDDEDAMLLVALCLSILGDHFGAIDWLRGTIHGHPLNANLLSALATQLSNMGAFSEARVVHQRAANLVPEDPVIHARQILDLDDNPASSASELSRLAQQWGQHFALTTGEDSGYPVEKPAILSVGVFLSDLPGTESGAVFAEMLGRANPAEFRVVGYGTGTLTDAENAGFQHSVSEWYDVTDLDSDTIADMFRAENLDIIIDTAGFAAPLALAAMGSRCASRQILWRNAPYGAGIANIDAQFSDSTLDAAQGPAPSSRRITLRHGTVLAQLPPEEAVMFDTAERSHITFGADVPPRHLTAETVAWWAELLLAVPESVIVLRDNDLRLPKTVERLTALFGNFGLAHRVDVQSDADNAVFWSQADIALMPIQGAIPQQAVEILWGGLPVLAPELPERGNRNLSSLLRHAGLDELVAVTSADFARIGAAWAKDSRRRESFRQSIRERLSASPVFDPEARAQDFWQACRQLYQ